SSLPTGPCLAPPGQAEPGLAVREASVYTRLPPTTAEGEPGHMDFWAPLQDEDPEIAALVHDEEERTRSNLELIASESYPSLAVLEAVGSVLTAKYAEGYPGRRYYGGCEIVDQVEELARQRAKELFGADHAKGQPHAGAQ